MLQIQRWYVGRKTGLHHLFGAARSGARLSELGLHGDKNLLLRELEVGREQALEEGLRKVPRTLKLNTPARANKTTAQS